MIRPLLFILFTLFLIPANAQTQLEVAKLDNTFKLIDGIYTSFNELLTNDPAFPNCILKVNSSREDVNIGDLKYYMPGNESDEIIYTSPLYSTVINGKLSIYYDQTLFPIYSKATVCTFILTKQPGNSYGPGYSLPEPGKKPESMVNMRSKYKYIMYFIDIQTGEIAILNKENLGVTIKRDSTLYKNYIDVTPGKDNKNLLKYIFDFNARNPTFLPVRETVIIEEQ